MTECGKSSSDQNSPVFKQSPTWNHGPIEDSDWSPTIQARVTTPGARPRVHGYDVEGDLAIHYGWVEFLLLSLTGELPSTQAVAAFNVAAMFIGPVCVAHASTHAAVVARICGASNSANVGVAAIALGEQTRFLLDEHVELLRWLASTSSAFPRSFCATSDSDLACLARLNDALAPTGQSVPGLQHMPTRSAALILTFHACGLRRRQQLEAAITLCRMPLAIAEAFGERAANFRSYPIDLPHFAYGDPT